MEEHERYMRAAIALAREAAEAGEVPVGCVVVCGGEIVGRGRNRQEAQKNALAHAEMEALADASRALGGWRLHGARLYVTLEPCAMCAGGILNARVPRVYFGARDAFAGACGSVLNLFAEGFHHRPALYGGILEEECAGLLSSFFQELRKKEREGSP